MQKLVLASGNQGKAREIQALLNSYEVITQDKFNIPEIIETGTTFVENAILKARNAANYVNLPTLADDSGLIIDVLNGNPGIISARYAGIHANDIDNINKVIQNIQHISAEKLTARFVCVIVYLRHKKDPSPIIAEGVWEGKIISTPKGKNGFGYDPIFWLDKYQCTSAELTPQLKNQVSHRSKALNRLQKLIKKSGCYKNINTPINIKV